MANHCLSTGKCFKKIEGTYFWCSWPGFLVMSVSTIYGNFQGFKHCDNGLYPSSQCDSCTAKMKCIQNRQEGKWDLQAFDEYNEGRKGVHWPCRHTLPNLVVVGILIQRGMAFIALGSLTSALHWHRHHGVPLLHAASLSHWRLTLVLFLWVKKVDRRPEGS